MNLLYNVRFEYCNTLRVQLCRKSVNLHLCVRCMWHSCWISVSAVYLDCQVHIDDLILYDEQMRRERFEHAFERYTVSRLQMHFCVGYIATCWVSAIDSEDKVAKCHFFNWFCTCRILHLAVQKWLMGLQPDSHAEGTIPSALTLRVPTGPFMAVRRSAIKHS
jgi:hypothetical protein